MDILYIPFGYIMKLCCLISGNNYVIALFFFALLLQIDLIAVQRHKPVSGPQTEPVGKRAFVHTVDGDHGRHLPENRLKKGVFAFNRMGFKQERRFRDYASFLTSNTSLPP